MFFVIKCHSNEAVDRLSNLACKYLIFILLFVCIFSNKSVSTLYPFCLLVFGALVLSLFVTFIYKLVSEF